LIDGSHIKFKPKKLKLFGHINRTEDQRLVKTVM